MLFFNLSPFALPRPFSALPLLGDASGASPTPATAAPSAAGDGCLLVSAYEDPPEDLDQRVRAVGEW
ncbi:hypothetical protein QRO11_11535 [Paracidovorax citrulli]|uniref:Uncharacterized protein n=1 Tax=Paracidovorax citrulli TaxID=80869 RepID=A0ABY9AVV1_PARCI|nr:hypothetical protein [Paracidovorax citrulli]ATG93032.1 hypothetical protein CQB05_02375 [Paracidovorax citrulli]MVT29058.1 hypothetical protein [Paracidovorax citrulli]MVT36730.1 hypothetical protein [Paracidovorax citrulli]PVY67238.1 hypothetical protein C8E08_4673 [Paracidovorax citrulli]QCX09119.1 hypothetical protein APS58_0138 [Paracidovorax citrulli]